VVVWYTAVKVTRERKMNVDVGNVKNHEEELK
jgi:hypothetical protein